MPLDCCFDCRPFLALCDTATGLLWEHMGVQMWRERRPWERHRVWFVETTVLVVLTAVVRGAARESARIEDASDRKRFDMVTGWYYQERSPVVESKPSCLPAVVRLNLDAVEVLVAGVAGAREIELSAGSSIDSVGSDQATLCDFRLAA